MIKGAILSLLRKFGYDLVKTDGLFWYDPFPYEGVKDLIEKKGLSDLKVFDIGANVGQTLDIYRQYFPGQETHAFEPAKSCFDLLSGKFTESNIKLNNLAVSNEKGSLTFYEYDQTDLSSLNKMTVGSDEHGAPKTYEVKTETLDSYCEENGIDKIHFLKTDTQGHEMQVFEGANRMLNDNRIYILFVELNFQTQYENEESYLKILNYLDEKGFTLVRLYHTRYDEHGVISWSDALFVNRNFQ